MKLTRTELRDILQKPPGELTGDDLRWLTRAQVECLTPAQIAGLSRELVAGMTADQLGALTPEQVRVMSLEQMGLVPATKPRKARIKAAKVREVEPERGAEGEVEPRVILARFHPIAIILRWLPHAWRAVWRDLNLANRWRIRLKLMAASRI